MPHPFELTGKKILITGASSGIGQTTAIEASRLGAVCILTGRNEARLAETLALLSGEGHQSFATDLLIKEGRDELAKCVPALDGIANCAGVVGPFPIRFLDDKKINEILDINYRVPVLMMSALMKAKKINTNASLVFISSIASQHPHKGGSVYGSSKAALETFVKTLALELQSQKVRCNCISPAMVKTPMYTHVEASMSKEELDKHVNRYPLGAGEPEDVAFAAIYFLSNASRWVNGVNLILDGGFLLQGVFDA
jgi:NAD(P)-dependent dehydrogenase (short-subunit alcohol dehydrogenase family)